MSALSESDGTGESETHTQTALADVEFIRDLREQMLKFATLQLNDAYLAEDAVQEALVGALKNVESFKRRAALKTWVFAILKNKIADTLRRRHREVQADELLHDGEYSDHIDELFNKNGFWHREERPRAWSDPDEQVQNEQFWRIFEVCLQDLPSAQSRVFMMREFLELDSDEVCKSAGISVSNLYVLLYRARLRLRECLEKRWFMQGQNL